jgi:hypothetical protein
VSGPTFVYIDYGPSPDIGLELRYSLATLLAEYKAPQVIIYTDKPDAYARLHASVTPRALDEDLSHWTRGGAYNHRLKPCVLLDALAECGGLCVLLDTDSYINPGFAAALVEASAQGPAMDHFEARDPYPEIAGFAANLPCGRYVYDPATARMFNSGLIAAQAGRDAPALADALALIDALWNADRRLFKIEQIAVSEAFRHHGLPIGEMAPAFHHYFRRSLKRYLHWRLRARERRTPAFAQTRPCVAHPRNAVRAYTWAARLGLLR